MARRFFSEELLETLAGVGLSVAIGVIRPSWLAQQVNKTLGQHFWRLFGVRIAVSVVAVVLKPYNDRHAKKHAELRQQLGREPTTDEFVAHLITV